MNVKPRATLLLFYVAISFLIGCAQSLQANEPVYQDRTLTSWLQDFSYGNYQLYESDFDLEHRMEKHHAAERAIRAMGTKALPALLDRLAVSSVTLDSKQNYPTFYEQNYRTIMAFKALGAQARPAIPELIKLLARAYDAAHQSLSEPGARLKDSQANTAASILRSFGEVAVHPLIDALGSKDSKIRFGAAMALEYFDDQVKDVVPHLIQALEDEDKDVRWRAVRSIGDVQQMPEISVPALARRVRDDPESSVRLYAIWALAKFGANATTALPDLSRAMSDPEPFIRSDAQEALEKIKAAATQKVADP